MPQENMHCSHSQAGKMDKKPCHVSLTFIHYTLFVQSILFWHIETFSEACCVYNNTLYPVGMHVDTVHSSDNCTQVHRHKDEAEQLCESRKCFQIDMVCSRNENGNGVIITHKIGYNCHDTIIEACNTCKYCQPFSESTSIQPSPGSTMTTINLG